MKHRFFLSVIALLPAFAVSAQWNQLPLNTSLSCGMLSFPANDTGYVLSQNIYRTNNGGASFDSIIVPGMGQCNSVHFRTGLEGTVCGYSANTPVVKRTYDGGATWLDVSPPPVPGTPLVAKFSGPLNGILLTSAPEFYVTTNGGVTWDTVAFGYNYFSSVEFRGQTGYIAGFDGTFAYRGVIYKSTNGGATWSPLLAANAWNTWFNHVRFLDADTGFVSFSAFTNTGLLQTDDGGATWDTLQFTHGMVQSFDFRTAQNGFVVNDSGSIYRTSDGGQTWQLDRAATTYMNDIRVTNSFAYASGYNGTLIKRNLPASVTEPPGPVQPELYPNPGRESATLSLPAGFNVQTVRLFDAAGKECAAPAWRTNAQGFLELDTRFIAPGWYVLEVRGAAETITLRYGKVE